MNRLSKLVALALLFAAPLFAGAPAIKGVYNILPTGVIVPTVMAASGTFTSDAFRIGETSVQAISWDIVTASGDPSVNVIIVQANTEAGTYSQWVALDGSTITSNVTITTASGGSPVRLIPGMFAKYVVLNSGSQNTTPTLRGFAQ